MRLRLPGPEDPPLEQIRAALGVVIIAIAAAAAVLFLAIRHQPTAVSAPARTDLASALPSISPTALLTVDVEGKVHRPGLQQLAAGSRVADALRAAGGVDGAVDLKGLNLARKLVDGEQIVVGAPAAAPTGAGASGGGLVNLNTATLAELDALPGVGPVTAQRILDWRTAHGQFASVDQLREVEGIGERTFARLKDLVTV